MYGFLDGTGREICGAGCAMLLTEGHRHRQRHPAYVDVLHNLIVGESGGPAVDIVQGHEGVLARRVLEHEIGEKTEFLPVCQLGLGGRPFFAHGPASPRITLTLRILACDAACVIQPDWAGCPLPQVMKP